MFVSCIFWFIVENFDNHECGLNALWLEVIILELVKVSFGLCFMDERKRFQPMGFFMVSGVTTKNMRQIVWTLANV